MCICWVFQREYLLKIANQQHKKSPIVANIVKAKRWHQSYVCVCMYAAKHDVFIWCGSVKITCHCCSSPGFMEHRIKVVRIPLYSSSIWVCVYECFGPRAKNSKYKTNERNGTNGMKEVANTNYKLQRKRNLIFLRHKDGEAQRMSMSCLCRINISNAAMYIYELHLVLYRYIFQMNNVMKTKKQTTARKKTEHQTAYFTINEDKLCTSDRMQFSLLYLPICESRRWIFFHAQPNRVSVGLFFCSFFCWFFRCFAVIFRELAFVARNDTT